MSIRVSLDRLRARVVRALHRVDRKQWLMRGLCALLISAILMLIAILVGTIVGVWHLVVLT